MESTWKARQMVAGKDTIRIMAEHYGLKPSAVRDIVKQAGVELIREDGFRGPLVRKGSSYEWSDGLRVDLETTKLTKAAILAVAQWKFQHDEFGNAA